MKNDFASKKKIPKKVTRRKKMDKEPARREKMKLLDLFTVDIVDER